MSTTYTAKTAITMNVSYECEHCEKRSSYSEIINGSAATSGENFNKHDLHTEAMTDLSKEIEKKMTSQEFGHEPCPNCGYMQSWQIKSGKSTRGVGLAVLAFLGTSTLLGVSWGLSQQRFPAFFEESLPAYTGCLVIAAVIALLAAAIFVASRANRVLPYDPNKKFGKVSRINRPTISWK
jgi:hypothetical protein